MTPTISLTESQTMTALRSFLLGIVTTNIEVVSGQDNRVPEPIGQTFVVMSILSRERIETNTVTTVDGLLLQVPVAGTRMDLQPVKFSVQLDVHGPGGGDIVQTITTLFRSEYGTTAFAASGFDVTPLYMSDPRQMIFINGEQQIENRWSVDAVMQCNPIVTTAQDFAASISISASQQGAGPGGLIDVDVIYPPI